MATGMALAAVVVPSLLWRGWRLRAVVRGDCGAPRFGDAGVPCRAMDLDRRLVVHAGPVLLPALNGGLGWGVATKQCAHAAPSHMPPR